VSGTAQVFLSFSAVLHNIVVEPNIIEMGVGTQKFTAQAFDQGGNKIPGASFTWSTAGPGSIDSNGTYYTPSVINSSTYVNIKVTATYGGVTKNQTAWVHLVPPLPSSRFLTSVKITPASLTLRSTDKLQDPVFTATAYDQNGSPLYLSFVWSMVAGPGWINPGNGTYYAPNWPTVHWSSASALIRATATYNGVTKSNMAYISLIKDRK
jgi:hypothetical protein